MTDINSRIQELNASGGIALLYFYNDHCAPCKSLRPKVDMLLRNSFPEVEDLKINTDEFPELSSGYNVFSAPVIILMAEGREFRRFSKYISVGELSESIERLQNLMK